MKDLFEILKEIMPIWLVLMTIAFIYLLLLFYRLLNKTNELSDAQSKYLKDRVEIIEKTTGIYEKTFLQQDKSIEQLAIENESLKKELDKILPKFETRINESVFSQNTESKKDITERLYKLNEMYEDVKMVTILAETISEQVISLSVQEVRNSFDHLMSCFKKDINVDVDKEFENATEHLFRGGIYAIEVLIMTKLKNLDSIIEGYKKRKFSKKSQKFYVEILQFKNEIIFNFAQIKKDTIDRVDKFRIYNKYVEKLILYESEVYKKILELEK
jgi:hypothetical protein